MKRILSALALTLSLTANAQQLFSNTEPLQLSPAASVPLHFGTSSDRAWKKSDFGENFDKLTQAEKESLGMLEGNNTKQTYWDTVGAGCSWYCGIGCESVETSSSLPKQGAVSYAASNIHDFTYRTVWAEGAKGYGIGEYITYTFKEEAPRITNILVANGYVKNQTAWEENSRVKTMDVFINDKPFATLHLKDERSEQRFEFDPIGIGPHSGKAREGKTWKLRLVITDVYKGTKYDDTVISELYFDGIDVH